MTNTQKAAAIQAMLAVLEAIVGLGEVPSGHLYARLMGVLSLTAYEAIIGGLVQHGLITSSGHLLKATDKGREALARMS